jgi:hypothetical protein
MILHKKEIGTNADAPTIGQQEKKKAPKEQAEVD